jgi:DNA-binding Xre family transcriptional regulator
MNMLRLRVKEIAEAQGMNQAKLQIKAEINMGVLRRYWYGQTGQVTFEVLEKLARALGVKPLDLLVDDEQEREQAA